MVVPSASVLYDFRVRLANGITTTVCAADREEAARFVKDVLGRYGGAGAHVAAVARIRRRDDASESHIILASDLRRFVANRKAGRKRRRPLLPYSVRYRRKKGPFAQRRPRQ